MFPTNSSRNSWLPSINGMLRISPSSDSELHSVDVDQLALLSSMTTKNHWSSSSLTTDSEDWRSYPKRTPREKPRNNSREKSRNLEELRKEKFWPLENQKPELTLKKPKTHTLRKSSLHDL